MKTWSCHGPHSETLSTSLPPGLGIKPLEPNCLGSNPRSVLIRGVSVGTFLHPSLPQFPSLLNQDDMYLAWRMVCEC